MTTLTDLAGEVDIDTFTSMLKGLLADIPEDAPEGARRAIASEFTAVAVWKLVSNLMGTSIFDHEEHFNGIIDGLIAGLTRSTTTMLVMAAGVSTPEGKDLRDSADNVEEALTTMSDGIMRTVEKQFRERRGSLLMKLRTDDAFVKELNRQLETFIKASSTQDVAGHA
jgi:hypothetical protein